MSAWTDAEIRITEAASRAHDVASATKDAAYAIRSVSLRNAAMDLERARELVADLVRRIDAAQSAVNIARVEQTETVTTDKGTTP